MFLAFSVIWLHSSINAPVISKEPKLSKLRSEGYKNKSLSITSEPLKKVIILVEPLKE